MGVRITGYQRAFKEGNDRLKQAALATVTRMAVAGETDIVERMKADGHTASGDTLKAVHIVPAKVVAQGLARASVAVQPSQMVPALILEDGRKPGKGVSREGQANLRKWVRRKGRAIVDSLVERIQAERRGRKRRKAKRMPVRELAEKQAVFLIARRIKDRGLHQPHGLQYFAKAARGVAAKAGAIYRDVLSKLPRRASR